MGKKGTLFIFLLLATTWILYGRALTYGLIWDSKPVILHNRLLQENFPLSSAFTNGWWELTGQRTGKYDYYRPMTTLSFMIEKRIWGVSPARIKAANILLFDLALILLYVFFRRQKERSAFPEIATALFALFPLHVDIVVWEVSRGDLLMLVWSLLSLLFIDSFLRTGKWYLGLFSSFFYGCGVFSKEAFVFFLPFFACYAFLAYRRVPVPLLLANTALTGVYWFVKTTFITTGGTPFLFLPGILENTKALLGAIGYYFRSLLFPFSYDMFVPVDQVGMPFYLIMGVAALAVFLALLWYAGSRREHLIPLALVAIFLVGHLLMVFLSIFPFNISSRYLFITSLGFVWIVTHHLLRIKGRLAYIIPAGLLAAFVPSVIANTDVYKDEATFWERTYRSSPSNSFILYKYAQTFFINGEYPQTEVLLEKALALPMQQKTAVAVCMTYARIEFEKADYLASHSWLDRIGSFGIDPEERLAWVDLKASLFISQGMCESAEDFLVDALRRLPREEFYWKLHDLYIGCNLWGKAKGMESTIRRSFPRTSRQEDVDRIKKDFDRMGPEQKVDFFIRYGNFYEARRAMEAIRAPNLEQQFLLTTLCYRSGDAEKGKSLADRISKESGNDPDVLNRLGELYLKEFSRLEEALFFFEESLRQNPKQPEIEKKVNGLRNLREGRLESSRD
jgi:tetratricopeptide (TPR) repeat protein